MIITLAWRNIWRNKKRTLITISSVTLAVVLAVFTRSFQEGTYRKMIENTVGQYTGYIQVHQKDYWKNKTLDNGIVLGDSLLYLIKSVKGVTGVNPRLENVSLASYGKRTKGVFVMGVNPLKEDKMIHLRSKIKSGELINENDSAIVLGSSLASYLNIKVGDTIVLLGQGYSGQTAVGAYPVKGIIKMPMPDIDNKLILMPLRLAQDYFSFSDGVTSLVIKINGVENTDKLTKSINEKLAGTQYKAMRWEEIMPEMVQLIESDRTGGIFMIGVLYMIIAFGVLGTVLMMTEERKREFAVMISIGMQKTKLITLTFFETLFLNLVSIILGILITIPIVIYYHNNPIRITGEYAKSIVKIGVEPILPTILEPSIFIHQIEVILVIVFVAFLFPLFIISRLKLIKYMRR